MSIPKKKKINIIQKIFVGIGICCGCLVSYIIGLAVLGFITAIIMHSLVGSSQIE